MRHWQLLTHCPAHDLGEGIGCCNLCIARTASKGNKTEQTAPLAFSILLALPMVVFFAYYLHFQTYV